ncbi:aspartyl-phosphate phosphatase Spo0E family protein [Cohnella lupini]|uniref:Spo0E like sporulation regulatory protein n=1 Tax=Cohnella lupini TaxID=1294267 RepID=A0A3D9I5W0_9BACL|nr:aspartyl-phosphate phosphatase Spo0E family protein [Cohnella lupini]RED57163.1 Spo0E like sporulation regulatory protein [Cohnella lupini]
MGRALRTIKQRIENLRNEMVLMFIQNGARMNDPQVLRLSQLLDDQLNRYERCVRFRTPGQAMKTSGFARLDYRRDA